jgi:hypothetical protein
MAVFLLVEKRLLYKSSATRTGLDSRRDLIEIGHKLSASSRDSKSSSGALNSAEHPVWLAKTECLGKAIPAPPGTKWRPADCCGKNVQHFDNDIDGKTARRLFLLHNFSAGSCIDASGAP